MDEEEQFLGQVLTGIAEADVISIFFPLLRRALVIDARSGPEARPMVSVMQQASSMEERIHGIERMRPELGKIRSILGIPWMKSVRLLGEQGVTECVVDRLVRAGVSAQDAKSSVAQALDQLWGIERLAFERVIRGAGYTTLWTARR
jgi:hypothetical protein